MEPQLFLLIGAGLGLLAILLWIDMRRSVASFPALKKLKGWQLLGLYLACWAAVSLAVGFFS